MGIWDCQVAEIRHHIGIVRSQCRDSPGTLCLVQFPCSLAVTLLELDFVQPLCVAPLLRALTSSDPVYRNIQEILFLLLDCQPRDTAIWEK